MNSLYDTEVKICDVMYKYWHQN